MPGVSRDTLLAKLNEIAVLDSGGRGQTAQDRICEYLEWATVAADQLALLVSAQDIPRLVLTPGYHRLLAAVGLPGPRYPHAAGA